MMKFPAIAIFLLVTSHDSRAMETAFSQKEFVSPSVGLLRTNIRGFSYRGSGTVVRDPRLIYSAAHNFYDRGVWAREYRFYPGIHQKQGPGRRRAAIPRGFHYLSRYAQAARFTDGESNQSFATDFVVLYGNNPFAPAVGIDERSAKGLRSDREKRIVGYPAGIDFTGQRGFYYQHSTGWFGNRASRILGSFLEFPGVSTGPGNSGGAVFFRDGKSGEDLFAGVLVSGSRRTAGVVAMSRASQRLADRALGSASGEFRTSNRNRIRLGRSLTTRTLPVHGGYGAAKDLSLAVVLDGDGATDTTLWLESPDGRVRRVTATSPLDGLFTGSAAAGTWKLHLRSTTGLPTTFLSATLEGTADETE